MFNLFPHLAGGAVEGMVLLSLTIIVSAFFLEEVTIVVVGLLAADGIISAPIALLSLYVGIILGDLGLYLLGWLASRHLWLGKYVDHDFIAPLREWLDTKYVMTIFSARFIPISRIPTYTACGFFNMPYKTFWETVVSAGIIWVSVLFTVTFWFGSLTEAWFGPARWVIACVFLLGFFLVSRHNVIMYRKKRRAMRASRAPS